MVHFIDSAWHLQSLCLDTVPLFSDHMGQNIAEASQDAHANWNISMSCLQHPLQITAAIL